jgi:predicted anti-sigma-YlaC factor YlaD
MMEHQQAQELFSDYLDGELPPEEQEAFLSHLQCCAICQKELNTLKQMIHSLSGLPKVPVPHGFDRKVQQRIYRRSHGRFFRSESVFMRLPFEWVSFIIIIIMLVLYLFMIQNHMKSVSPTLPPAQDGSFLPIQPK